MTLSRTRGSAWQGTDRSEVRDAAAFLATTTTRLAINIIQSARSRHETYIGPQLVDSADPRADPSLDAEHDEALDLALRLLLSAVGHAIAPLLSSSRCSRAPAAGEPVPGALSGFARRGAGQCR
jgi:DNA-directed RNA polymerase specialized sigma24 family protein